MTGCELIVVSMIFIIIFSLGILDHEFFLHFQMFHLYASCIYNDLINFLLLRFLCLT